LTRRSEREQAVSQATLANGHAVAGKSSYGADLYACVTFTVPLAARCSGIDIQGVTFSRDSSLVV